MLDYPTGVRINNLEAAMFEVQKKLFPEKFKKEDKKDV